MALNTLLPELSPQPKSYEKRDDEKSISSVDSHKSSNDKAHAEFVEQLSSSELNLINEYSVELESLGVDKKESYAMSLDSYIKGVERCYLPQQQVVLTDNNNLNNYNLRDLFKLPKDFADANNDDYDIDLVESYAEEIKQSSVMDPAIAYGIALDTYLADPVMFRHTIGMLALPRTISSTKQSIAFDEKSDVPSIDEGKNIKPQSDLKVDTKKGINTPLKKAINARRKSHNGKTVSELKDEIGKHMNAVEYKKMNNTPVKCAMSPTREILYRSSKSSTAKSNEKLPIKKSISTPLKKAIQAKGGQKQISKTPSKEVMRPTTRSGSAVKVAILIDASQKEMSDPLKDSGINEIQLNQSSNNDILSNAMVEEFPMTKIRRDKRKRSLVENDPNEEFQSAFSPLSKKSKISVESKLICEDIAVECDATESNVQSECLCTELNSTENNLLVETNPSDATVVNTVKKGRKKLQINDCSIKETSTTESDISTAKKDKKKMVVELEKEVLSSNTKEISSKKNKKGPKKTEEVIEEEALAIICDK